MEQDGWFKYCNVSCAEEAGFKPLKLAQEGELRDDAGRGRSCVSWDWGWVRGIENFKTNVLPELPLNTKWIRDDEDARQVWSTNTQHK
jgi:hypothetical protein